MTIFACMADTVTLSLCEVSLDDLEIECTLRFDQIVLSTFAWVTLLEYVTYSLGCCYEAIAISSDDSSSYNENSTQDCLKSASPTAT